MDSRRPKQRLPFQCPFPHCRKGFENLSDVQKHVAMSMQCGLYLQKLLQTQSIDWTNKTDLPKNNATTILPPAQPATTLLQQEEILYDNASESLFDNVLSVEDVDANNNLNTVLPEDKRTVDSHTNKQYFECKLLKLLDEANAPHFLFQQIMEWAQEAAHNGYSFQPKRITRRAHITQLKNWLNLSPLCYPFQVMTELPVQQDHPSEIVPVTTFNFTAQLSSLLFDSNLFDNIDNLDVSPKNPFGKYKTNRHKLSTINSGQRYHEAYMNMVKDPLNDFLMPIIFCCDETKLVQTGKTSCWPLMFTTSILYQACRNTSQAWNPLGYVYDLSMLHSTAEEKLFGNDLKYSRLHKVLETILSSFVEAQQPDALTNVALQPGNQIRKVNLKVPCFFIIGDMQGGDKLCACAPAYSNTLRCLCRACNIAGCDAGNPNIECACLKTSEIETYIKQRDVDELQNLNQYCVDNAWLKVDFGGCPYGIFSASCPVEPLHAVHLECPFCHPDNTLPNLVANALPKTFLPFAII